LAQAWAQATGLSPQPHLPSSEPFQPSMAAESDIRSFLTRSSFWVYVVFALHFALCFFYISKAPGDQPYVVAEGLTLPPHVQWPFVAFCLASVFFIVQAYIGAVYGLENHLNMYYYFLAASAIVDIGLLFVLIWAWLSTFGPALLLSLSIAFKIVAMYVTSKYSKVVRSQYNAELIPHLKSALGRSFGQTFGVAPPAEMQQPAATPPEAYPRRTMYSEGSPLQGRAQEPFPSMPAPRSGVDYFGSLDKNQDGTLSRDEFDQATRVPGSRQVFSTMPSMSEAPPGSSRLVRIVQ